MLQKVCIAELLAGVFFQFFGAGYLVTLLINTLTNACFVVRGGLDIF
jgi:hypothetical protein